MALRSKLTALIHGAKAQLGLGDDDYRAILLHEAGVETSRDLDNDGFDAVMERLKALGFKPTVRPPAYGHRAGMATPAQVAYIRSLWKEYTEGVGDDRSLGKWLQRTVKVSDLRFVSFAAARKAITGLRAMVQKKAA
ncbi:MAG: regulatory protein GemA [Rhodospirillales bacterium]|nr:regulatory protein GemA [Rhodospirillales bacterium]